MCAIIKRLSVAVALAAIWATAFPSTVLAAAGRVIFVSGEATLIRGGIVPVERGMDVQAGDTFVTGGEGRMQILMADGERIALRPGTRFSIDEFSGPARGAADQPSAWRSFYSLARGGFNTLTRSLGTRDENSYRVKTPVATIGIRGTYFAAVLCQGGSCGGYGGSNNTRDGLYVGVSDGAVELHNNAGSLIVGDDEYALVQDKDSSPQQLDKPPEFLNSTPPASGDGNFEEQVSGEETGTEDFSTRRSPDEGTTTEDGASSETTAEGTVTDTTMQAADSTASTDSSGTTFTTDATPPLSITATDTGGGGTVDLTGGGATPPPGNFRGVAFSGPGNTSGAAINDGSAYGFDGAAGLTSFKAADGTHDIGSASNVNQGFDATTGLRWGRWAGGTASVPQSQSLASSSQHWVYGPATADVPVLPVSGSATYTLVGNTNPTDNNGNVGFLGSASLGANFTNQTVNSTVNVGGFGAQAWNASGSGSIQQGTFAGTYGCSSGCQDGNFAGFFTDNADGAGMGYSLKDNSGTTVSGAAAFRKN